MSPGRYDELSEGVLLDPDAPDTILFESRETPIPDDAPTKVSEPRSGGAKRAPSTTSADSDPPGGEVGLGHLLHQTRVLEETRDEVRRIASSYEGLARMLPAAPDRATQRRREVGGMLGVVALVSVLLAVAFCAGVGVGGGW